MLAEYLCHLNIAAFFLNEYLSYFWDMQWNEICGCGKWGQTTGIGNGEPYMRQGHLATVHTVCYLAR